MKNKRYTTLFEGKRYTCYAEDRPSAIKLFDELIGGTGAMVHLFGGTDEQFLEALVERPRMLLFVVHVHRIHVGWNVCLPVLAKSREDSLDLAAEFCELNGYGEVSLSSVLSPVVDAESVSKLREYVDASKPNTSDHE